MKTKKEKEEIIYLESEVKEICWKLIESIVNEEHLRESIKGYRHDFDIWFSHNKKKNK